MYSRARLLTVFIVTLLVCFLTTFTGLAQEKLTEQSKVFINGIGPVRVGMTISQASKAAGTRFVRIESGGEEYGCFYFKPQSEPREVSFMVTKGRISRVDVESNRRITTVKGARIGDTEARIKSLYPKRIRVTQHVYVERGHYLTFIPQDRPDRNYRLVFETDGDRVTNFRSGQVPEVEAIEGCS
jgi:hypothetical protein